MTYIERAMMRRIFAIVSFPIIGTLVLCGCKPSYPRQQLTESVRDVVKKEYNLDGTARLAGDTLYLDVKLSGLTTTEPEVLTAILKKVQGAVLAITRVSLSSDAKIRFMVVSANDPTWKLGLRIIQRLEDVKGYLYQKISRSDYEDRLILEIGGKEHGALPGNSAAAGLDMKEFVGRLIVSQVNLLGRTNPFLSVLLGNSQLEFTGFNEEELVVRMESYVSPQALPLFEEIVGHQSKKTLHKFNVWQPKRIKIIDNNNQVFSVNIPR